MPEPLPVPAEQQSEQATDAGAGQAGAVEENTPAQGVEGSTSEGQGQLPQQQQPYPFYPPANGFYGGGYGYPQPLTEEEIEINRRNLQAANEARAARDAARLARFEERKADIIPILRQENERIESSIDETVLSELITRMTYVALSEPEQQQVFKDYRSQRIRAERLHLVQSTARRFDVSAKCVATELIAIMNDRSNLRSKNRAARLERRKAKWVSKMLENSSETQVNQRLAQRRRQLEIGYNTIGFAVWDRVKDSPDPTYKVPKEVRIPVPEQLCSKRGWDGLIRQWRQRLHQYDKFAAAVLTPEEIRRFEEQQALAQQKGQQAVNAKAAAAASDGEDDDDGELSSETERDDKPFGEKGMQQIQEMDH
jgi:histone RNA hairpin-binding protein